MTLIIGLLILALAGLIFFGVMSCVSWVLHFIPDRKRGCSDKSKFEWSIDDIKMPAQSDSECCYPPTNLQIGIKL